MKRFLTLFTILFIASAATLSGQESVVDSLVALGIEYHDAGQYRKAIRLYEEALQVDPESEIVHYEIAISLVEAKDYYTAIAHCDKLIERDDKFALLAYNTKGSCLNYLGKTDEAIDNYLEGIEKSDEFYLLYYNLGLAYHTKGDFSLAEEAFIRTIELNPQYGKAHLNLARTMTQQNRRVESLLSLYYYLLIEPFSEDTEWAYNNLILLLNLNRFPGGVETVVDESLTELEVVDAILSRLAILNKEEETDGKTKVDKLIRSTNAFFDSLGDIKKKNNPKGFWWDFYVPFYAHISSWDYVKVYCHYISRYFYADSADWLNQNGAKVNSFSDWLRRL
ncbi:tetratricopeptide (TPR) repeat protein [Parabacteroides sp. PFB2-10]|uniref:tetratricopeptide repeat protein n=1 Tax=Parabacteroides sp. PFB2-10 TaxID=1742405 RepID=UPI0024763EA0|nr:tetratricopeptide repeat protein [Parabacteroides sp. PFB2-10]MDH6311998.1 tetratricopeptide (TPR) repeat protein [Parabacteroides sp. PFB2-10]MDL2245282.1 tetratricopeptide repeat protein [Parabacteroides sp. OttesenSCG-928-J18]